MEHANPNSLTITLPTDQMERLDDAVQSGEYTSKDEVIVEALKLWQQTHLSESEVAWLRHEHEAGLASGLAEDLSKEELLAQIKAEFLRG